MSDFISKVFKVVVTGFFYLVTVALCEHIGGWSEVHAVGFGLLLWLPTAVHIFDEEA